MKDATVRLESIEIKDFKNVRYGKLTLENSRKFYNSSILGLYGQNGSGKTALIDAILLLKFALAGQPMPSQFADYVNIDASFANLKYCFKVKNIEIDAEYDVVYEFNIRKEISESSPGYRAVIFDEILSYSYESKDEKLKLQPIINTRTNDVFGPVSKYNDLVGSGKETKASLLANRKFAHISSKSFVFSKELLDTLHRNCKEKRHLFLIENLVLYGNFELFVINTANTCMITVNGLPLNFKYEEKGEISIGNFMINLNEPTSFSEKQFDVVKKVIENMNIVLAQLVPGLTIGIRNLGTELSEDASQKIRIQLVSKKNNKEIPLKYESEGIKKIISVLQLLIVVYNNPSVTVAIDELDSGIFEYLLGEILRIISEKGLGQLIFTSHNLRPLETIDRGFIAFTTTDPKERYIRLANIKTNNNLRDFYYRDIVLGEQRKPVYDSTNNYEIDLAFMEAGETSGS
ncbi:AAA family ATPase [bacterium]|nr:AAA family ATPase [bacterium]